MEDAVTLPKNSKEAQDQEVMTKKMLHLGVLPVHLELNSVDLERKQMISQVQVHIQLLPKRVVLLPIQ